MAMRPLDNQPKIVTLPGTIPHMPAVARILARHDRDHLAAFIAVAIDLLDVLEGDPDLEDATDLEDDFALSPVTRRDADKGPGCPIADSDYCLAGDDTVLSGSTTRAGTVEDLGPGDADDAEFSYGSFPRV